MRLSASVHRVCILHTRTIPLPLSFYLSILFFFLPDYF